VTFLAIEQQDQAALVLIDHALISTNCQFANQWHSGQGGATRCHRVRSQRQGLAMPPRWVCTGYFGSVMAGRLMLVLIELVQHRLVDNDGRVEPVDGARAFVEQVGNGIELFLAVHRKVRALGQELADQPVGVLARAALPGAVRVTEVHHHAGVGRQLAVAHHLLALVVGQCLAHRLGNAAQLGGEALQGRGRCRIGQLDQHHQTRTALEQHAHRRAVTRALDLIALPVPGERPVTGLGRAHMDAQQIGHLAPAILAPAARHALGLGSAQTGNQVFAQLALGHGVDPSVDALVGDGALGFIGPHEFECARDL